MNVVVPMPKECITVIAITEDQILKFSIEYIHDAGRVVPYEDLLDVVHGQKAQLVSLLKRNNSEWTLLTLLKNMGRVFYVYDIDGYEYVSLARNYAYMNPRFAMALEKVTDKNKEAIIVCEKENTMETNSALRYVTSSLQEYALAKSSLAVLEILNAVYKCVIKGKHKVPFKRVIDKYDGFSSLAKALIHFCGREEISILLETFLSLFKFTFQMDKALLSVDFVLLDGLIKAYEIDLIWSYAGVCVINGMVSLTKIQQKVNDMISKAKMRFKYAITLEDLINIFQQRVSQFFLPGDNTVHIMCPCVDIPDERLSMIKKFFDKYLLKKKKPKHIHYTKCYEILAKLEPALLEGCEDQNATTISSMLFSSPEKFNFVDGFISLAPENRELKKVRPVLPIEVPFLLTSKSAPSFVTSPVETDGIVQEVGIRSALIRFHQECSALTGSSYDRTFIDVSGYCHKSSCLYGHRTVEDFSLFLKIGDCVKLAYQPLKHVNISSPHYNSVICILLDPDDSFLNRYELESSGESNPSYEQTLDSLMESVE